MLTSKFSYLDIWTVTHVHTCIFAYLPTGICAYLHICIFAYMHICISAYLHSCILAYLHTCTLAYLHTCILAYLHTCILAYLHACMSLTQSRVIQQSRQDHAISNFFALTFTFTFTSSGSRGAFAPKNKSVMIRDNYLKKKEKRCVSD